MNKILIVSKEISEAFNVTNKVPLMFNDAKIFIASDIIEMFYNIYKDEVKIIILPMETLTLLEHKTVTELKKKYTLKFIPYNMKYDVNNIKNNPIQSVINKIILKLLGDNKNEILCENAL